MINLSFCSFVVSFDLGLRFCGCRHPCSCVVGRVKCRHPCSCVVGRVKEAKRKGIGCVHRSSQILDTD